MKELNEVIEVRGVNDANEVREITDVNEANYANGLIGTDEANYADGAAEINGIGTGKDGEEPTGLVL